MRIHTSLMALLLAAGSLAAQAPVASLEVFPPDINLSTSRARQAFVVQAVQADGHKASDRIWHLHRSGPAAAKLCGRRRAGHLKNTEYVCFPICDCDGNGMAQ